RAALGAALFVALSPALVLYTPALMTEGLVATGLVALAWLSLVIADAARDSARAFWVMLVLVGAAVTLGRPPSVLLMPLFGWVAAGSRAPLRRRLGSALMATALTVAACLPWTARNCARMDRCVFVSANGGWNLLIGTFPEGQGAWVGLDGP